MRIHRFAWACVLGCLLPGGVVLATDPFSYANQRLADHVAATLRSSSALREYSVDVTVGNGVVELTGQVGAESQRAEVLRTVRSIPGVVQAVDRMTVSGQGANLVPVQGPSLPPARLPEVTAPSGAERREGPALAVPNGGMPEPTPMYRTGTPAFTQLNPPRMPPYAWPTYAPYNNFSRVGTPTAYPYQSWPFIGPPYPFPKVPLGWRSVKLEWDDGYWWYGQVANKHNWWKLRYW